MCRASRNPQGNVQPNVQGNARRNREGGAEWKARQRSSRPQRRCITSRVDDAALDRCRRELVATMASQPGSRNVLSRRCLSASKQAETRPAIAIPACVGRFRLQREKLLTAGAYRRVIIEPTSRFGEVDMSERLVRNLLPVVVGAGCMILLLSAMNAVAPWTNASQEIGDIIAFEASAMPSPAGTPDLLVDTAEGGWCAIDLSTIHRVGGSFLVVGRRPAADGRFIVHWAGPRTTSAAHDCGSDRSLVVDQRQLDSLARAAAAVGPRSDPSAAGAALHVTTIQQTPA